MTQQVSLMQVKAALKDSRFREILPKTIDLQQYLNNPGCACNVPLYKKILQDCKPQLQEYFPGRSIANLEEEIKQLAQNNWQVINTHVDQLENELRKLGVGRKQITVARYEEQCTVIVNHLDIIF